MSEYLPRVDDAELTLALRSNGAILIEGPKACGKTSTAAVVAATTVQMDTDGDARALVSVAPDVLLADKTPILFDEWQTAPELWNLIRRAVDRDPTPGRFILTGSASPAEDVNRHSGAGRIATMRMRPMSLYETGHSTGQVSVAQMFDNEIEPQRAPSSTLQSILERIVVGGWPSLIDADERRAQRWVRDYLRQTAEVDVQNLGTRRDPHNVTRAVSALARATGTETAVARLAADIGGNIKPETVDSYLSALRRLFLTEDLPAWAPHLRSRVPLRQGATRYFTDPSLAASALGANTQKLTRDLNTAGFLFENLVVRDLRSYAVAVDAELFHYRDKDGDEVDVILETRDGRWGAIEIKLNPARIDEATRALTRLRNKVDLDRKGEPSFLAMVTTHGIAARNDGGILTVPVTALGP